jgi:hypothetical protein
VPAPPSGSGRAHRYERDDLGRAARSPPRPRRPSRGQLELGFACPTPSSGCHPTHVGWDRADSAPVRSPTEHRRVRRGPDPTRLVSGAPKRTRNPPLPSAPRGLHAGSRADRTATCLIRSAGWRGRAARARVIEAGRSVRAW